MIEVGKTYAAIGRAEGTTLRVEHVDVKNPGFTDVRVDMGRYTVLLSSGERILNYPGYLIGVEQP